MTPQDIYDLLKTSIKDKTLTLKADAIDSESIKQQFKDYLLDKDLVIKEAELAELDLEGDITLTGKGASFLLYKTKTTLTFKVNDEAVTMTAKAEADEKDEWTFGEAFPALKKTDWGGYRDAKEQWVQKIYFAKTLLTLEAGKLGFTGTVKFKGNLVPLLALYQKKDIQIAGDITLEKGKAPFVADEKTVIPLMLLSADKEGVKAEIGKFSFKFLLTMEAKAKVDDKGAPTSQRAIPLNGEVVINKYKIKTRADLGDDTGFVTLKADLPKDKKDQTLIGMADLITLVNNANVLPVFPANIPVINQFGLRDWLITINTTAKNRGVSKINVKIDTVPGFSWSIVPDVLALKSLNTDITFDWSKPKTTAVMKIAGGFAVDTGATPAIVDVTGEYPKYMLRGELNPKVPLNLKAVITHFTGKDGMANSLPNLEVTKLEILADSKNQTYLVDTVFKTDLTIKAGIASLTLKQVQFKLNYVAGNTTGGITGDLELKALSGPKPVTIQVAANYNGPVKGWVYNSSLAKGSEIDFKSLINTYLPEPLSQFNPVNITVTDLSVAFNDGADKSYAFKIKANWKPDLGLIDVSILADVNITYVQKKGESDGKYGGYIAGYLNLGNLNVLATVNFDKAYNDYTFIFNNTLQAKLSGDVTDRVLTFKYIQPTSLGDIIGMLVKAAVGYEVTIPSPWDVINQIKLNEFELKFSITKKRVSLVYTPKVGLGFAEIDEISLIYDYSGPKSKVMFQITKGKFLGLETLPEPWDVTDPDAAPKVPGGGDSKFHLEFLGMGQHVALAEYDKFTSIAEAIQALENAFEKKEERLLKAGGDDPIAGTGLTFDSSRNWMIGTKFTILDTFAVSVVFLDPDFYGLSLNIDGKKAKVFQGLQFEVLYRKVTDTVGVYQIYLKLPDSIREFDFGGVAVTLPSLKLYIYTNGDFKVDLGFPVEEDFSESFSLLLLPFSGSGGLYFGALSAATSEIVPKTTRGSFTPVIVFGLGLKVGIEKSIDKGILKAGFSIAVVGILEGTFAQYNDYRSSNKDEVFYHIQGKLALVGRVYGSIDLGIIAADLDLKVFASAAVLMQSYQQTYLNLAAGVSVALQIKINLGLFKVYITLSYSTTVEESFVFGTTGGAPWDRPSLFRTPALLNSPLSDNQIPEMNWLPIIPETKVDLEVIYIPQFTAATERDEAAQKAMAVAMLYLQTTSPDGGVSSGETRSDSGGVEDYAFGRFAKGVFVWVLAAYLNKTATGFPLATLLDEEVAANDLSNILTYLSQADKEVLTVADILVFMENYLDVTIKTPERNALDEKAVSIFPMLPMLVLETPFETVYFNDERSKYSFDKEQIKQVRAIFKELAVRNQPADAGTLLNAEEPGEKRSLASLMLVDYVVLLAKESLQHGITQLNALPVKLKEEQSLSDFVNNNPELGISAEELAFANRTRSLSSDTALQIINASYTVKHDDTLPLLASKYNIATEHIVAANTVLKGVNAGGSHEIEYLAGFSNDHGLVAGEQIKLPLIKYVTSANNSESLLSIANKYGIAVETLISDNVDVAGLFGPGRKLVVPFAQRLSIGKLVTYMDEHHDFEHMAGLSANVMLKGLRIPIPLADSKLGAPEAMYKITGQQIDASALIPGNELTLTLPAPLSWLNLAAKGGEKLSFTLIDKDVEALQKLQRAKLSPNILELVADKDFEVQPRKFTLSTYTEWESPDTIKLSNGDHNGDNADPKVWDFGRNLQSMIAADTNFTPKITLLKQVQETVTKAGNPTPVAHYSWSTKIDVKIRPVKSNTNPLENMPHVYEVQGIDQASMTLLCNLIKYHCDKPLSDSTIKAINVLYAKAPAVKNQQGPPVGLKSDKQINTTLFLLQNNLSTLSNPPKVSLANTLLQSDNSNLLGMYPITFLQYLWEASVVGSGGYFLYYEVRDSHAGLPDYLFNTGEDGSITLVIEYNIKDDMLHNFFNSAIITDTIDVEKEVLYAEAISQTVTNIQMNQGDTLAAIAKRYRTTVTNIASQNQHVVLNNGLPIKLWKDNLKGELHTTNHADTLSLLSGRLNTSIATLAYLNKDVPQLFKADLTFDTRVEIKVATIPAGTMGFRLKRKVPGTIASLSPEEAGLQELYQLLEYNIAANADFNESKPGLPLAMGDKHNDINVDPTVAKRPLIASDNDWQYDKVVPVYSFVKGGTGLSGDDIPDQAGNPYRSVGKIAELSMRWNDVFGNQTQFTNVPAAAKLAPYKMGYNDPLIGLSQFPSLAGSYLVDKDVEGKAALFVKLAFNQASYDRSSADENWQLKARIDSDTYKTIYYQLSQPDVTVAISCSIDPQLSVFQQGENSPKKVLLSMVLAIYKHLLELAGAAGREMRIPAAITPMPEFDPIILPLTDANPESLFPLTTALTTARNPQLVEDKFKDEPSVISSISILGPDLSTIEAGTVKANGITIQDFARKLQDNLPALKVASGNPSLGNEADTSKQLWAVRFSDDANAGISLTVQNAANPYYFALKPLSRYLLSQDQVKIYRYATGAAMGDKGTTFDLKSFSSIDIEKMAADFLTAIDSFLQASIAVPGWIVQSHKQQGVLSENNPYSNIIKAKILLAENIALGLDTVLNDDNAPCTAGVMAARERLKQQLLMHLSDAYTIDTILQFKVKVKSPYSGNVIAPNLFGKVTDPNATAAEQAYAFSTSRFSIKNSEGDQTSDLTILFNTKKESTKTGETQIGDSYFPVSLQMQLNAIEHDIQSVAGVKDYKSSSWLSFILPPDEVSPKLGDLQIPIPLRAYPSAPSLGNQTFVTQFDQFKGLLKTGVNANDDLLDKAKAWNYEYSYNYLRASQDVINTEIIFNTSPDTRRMLGDDNKPSLFEALLQFSAVYPQIQEDINKYLVNEPDENLAFTAMKSLAWLADRVARAWGNWNGRKPVRKTTPGELKYRYSIAEGKVTLGNTEAVMITIAAMDGSEKTFPVPQVRIQNYLVEPAPNTSQDDSSRSFVYYTEEDGVKIYLTPALAGTERIVSITGSDIPGKPNQGLSIISYQSALAGISLTRNRHLVPGKKTNSEFIYETPSIRFINVLTPLLDPDISINIADFTPADTPTTLPVYLSNFFKALFKEIDGEQTNRVIKITSGYSYSALAEYPDLVVSIPISIVPPTTFQIPNDCNITNDTFTSRLGTMLTDWFKQTDPIVINGTFRFDITLFSSLPGIELPTLRLRNLSIKIKDLHI